MQNAWQVGQANFCCFTLVTVSSTQNSPTHTQFYLERCSLSFCPCWFCPRNQHYPKPRLCLWTSGMLPKHSHQLFQCCRIQTHPEGRTKIHEEWKASNKGGTKSVADSFFYIYFFFIEVKFCWTDTTTIFEWGNLVESSCFCNANCHRHNKMRQTTMSILFWIGRGAQKRAYRFLEFLFSLWKVTGLVHVWRIHILQIVR